MSGFTVDISLELSGIDLIQWEDIPCGGVPNSGDVSFNA